MSAPAADESSAEAVVPPNVGVSRLHTTLDDLIARHTEGDYRTQVMHAKEAYFELSGKVFDDDGDIFESRLASFLEWYALERPLDGGEDSPALHWLRQLNPSSDTARALAALLTSHHSLFDVSAVSEHTVELEDLLGGARFSVTERRSTVGFEIGQIVEARILWDGQSVVFGKTFLFHPREARQEVLDHVDAALVAGVAPREILFQLARLHLRWYRSRHISAIRIYGESRVGAAEAVV